MSGRWRKLGLLYCPSDARRSPKLLTHAANPLAVPLGDDVYRVFFSGRDARNRSSVGAVDINIDQVRLVREFAAPFFEHGPKESFYSDGVSIGNWYATAGALYVLFMGWHNPEHGHWRGEIGRLRLQRDGTLQCEDASPFLGLDPVVDPVSLSYPFVLRQDRIGYRMWYGSTITWDVGNGEMLHPIHSARSGDGRTWEREGLAVPYEIGRAQAFSRPTVIGDLVLGFQMWFSYRGGRGTSYRIGHAFSEDGRAWTLDLDSAGIDVSADGWDSEMVEYPYVFDHKGQRYMLYNGNGYGRTGFGLAVWTHSS